MAESVQLELVKKTAELAQLPISAEQTESIRSAFVDTLKVIENLNTLDVSTIEPTYTITGLSNVLREDVVTPDATFTQAEALANAAHTADGFFVVERILEND